MKTKLSYFVLFFIFTSTFYAQNIPIIKVGENQIAVKKLSIDVRVIGDIAITTYDMQFYNPNRRVLEGELSFPLEENQSVTRFALDINDNLREAVVVEKEKARVAFESTVRNRIDPALLEKTKGNNYKARIYPIPARGYKRVVLAFQQKLLINNEAYFYKIPFNYKQSLEDFSFKMKVLNQKNKPIITKGFKSNFVLNQKTGAYFLKIKSKKKNITKPLLVRIPLNSNKKRIIVEDDVFYFSKQFNFARATQSLENDITIFWDKSLSQQYKKIETELEFLDRYFKKVKDCKVNLIVFNTKIRDEKQFEIHSGNWSKLKQRLENTIYEGASSFNFLNTYKDHSKVNFLFTDGLNTLSDLKVNLDKKTHIINSAVAANHNILKGIANSVAGNYINLQQISLSNAFKKLTSKQIQFLGTNIPENKLEVYPKKGAVIQNSFSLLGKGNIPENYVKLFFGIHKDTLKTVIVDLKNNSKNGYISKIWAQKKVEYLAQNSEKNEAEIVKLSKEYQVISDFTSMLILDRVEDYVTHKIEPPKELKKQYDRILSIRRDNTKQRLAILKRTLFNQYEDFFNWFEKDYITQIKLKKRTITTTTQQNIDTIRSTARDLNSRFKLTGVVTANTETLPGVSVILKGTSRGTSTDFDGKYEIDANLGDILQFSYLGFISQEITVSADRNINVVLETDDSVLDEVVVVAYGIVKKSEVTGAITSIKAESIENDEQSRVAGITANYSNGQTGASSNIRIRGTSSVQDKKTIYVVDGVVVDDISDINTDDVKSTYVLNEQQSLTLYGSRASSGVVVISTKKGVRKNAEKINEFENLVKDKIELEGWNPQTPYLTILKKVKDSQKAYEKYIEIRDDYKNSPSFFIDVADFFIQRKDKNRAIEILTNVAEIDLDNYELQRALAYKFEEYQLYNYAVHMYQEILKLRPEDIQSHRDLALGYEMIGEYQKSLDLLYKIVNGELLLKDENRRYSGIEMIALNELNRIITLYQDKIEFGHINKKFIKKVDAALKVVIDWNHNDTDIDLWVIDPDNEKCFYGHKRTKIGGLISDDMTEGFGPEQFILKDAIKGSYNIKVKYFANSKQKISGPTFLKLTIHKNYGRKNETKKIQLVRLINTDDILDLGKLMF